MTAAEADILIQKGEGMLIEFKEAQGGIPSDLYESVVAMANTDGGSVFLGVQNDGTILGLTGKLITAYLTDIPTALNNPSCIKPPYLITPITINHAKGDILLLQMTSSSQVHNHAGRIFIRNGDADIDISDNQQGISNLYLRKQNLYSEGQIFPHLTMNDLEPSLFDKARQIIRSAKPSHPWAASGNEDILQASMLYRKDYQTGKEGLTLAAALIFGKDSTIQSILPAYKIEAMVRRINLDRYDDRLTLRTNLIDSYSQLMEFITKQLPEKFFTEDGQRKDLRELIFREVVGNLLVHREYNNPVSSEVIIYKDKVVTTNPNKALFHGPLDLKKFNPYAKNPTIRHFFMAFGWTDEIGSGVRNTRKYLAVYTPGMEPAFIENDIFRIEVPLLSATMENYTQKWLQWLDLSEKALPHLEAGFGHINLDPAIAGTDWEGLLLHLVPDWNQKGTRLIPLDWPENEVVIAEEIKKVPGWSQKGTKLLHKKIRYLLSIMSLTARPTKRDDLMNWIGYRNKKTFRDIYLLPLQETGLIAMTNPDKPSDPEQQYVLTEKGKMFLTARNF